MKDLNEDVMVSVEDALEELRTGKILIVTDDEDRENEGDFIMAAEKASPEAVNFIVSVGRGLLCQAITLQRAWELSLPFMVNENSSVHTTAFTVSVDAREGTTTGISTFDRAKTIKTLIDPNARPEDLLRPGHIFPLVAREGGLLARQGHTEASVDLCRIAGLYPSGILCEILDEDGSMARLPRLVELAHRYSLKIITVKRCMDFINRKLSAPSNSLPTQDLSDHPPQLSLSQHSITSGFTGGLICRK